MKRELNLWRVILALGLAPTAAHAIEIPGSAEPGQIERRFDQPPLALPETESLPSVPPQAPTGPTIGGSFKLTAIKLDGVTVYAPATLRKLYADKIGKKVSFGDLQSVAARITERYRADGYLLSQAIIPDQGRRARRDSHPCGGGFHLKGHV